MSSDAELYEDLKAEWEREGSKTKFIVWQQEHYEVVFGNPNGPIFKREGNTYYPPEGD